jgi:hypothetical protein
MYICVVSCIHINLLRNICSNLVASLPHVSVSLRILYIMPRAPKTGAVGSTEHTSLALKVPAVIKTNDPTIDTELESQRYALMTMIDDFVRLPDHILPMRAVLDGRKRKDSDPHRGVADCFKVVTTFSKLDEAWLAYWVTQHSDLTLANLVAAKRHDKDSTFILASLAAQVPASLKLKSHCRIKVVMYNVLEQRALACGTRIKTFKAQGGITADGAIDLKARGCYTMDFDAEDRCINIAHVASGAFVVPAAHIVITKAFALINNHLDKEAAVVLKPLPPLKLASLFGPDLGPHVYTHISGGTCAQFDAIVDEVHTAYSTTVIASKRGIAAPEFKTELDKPETEIRKVNVKRAREMAKLKITERKTKRTITLG